MVLPRIRFGILVVLLLVTAGCGPPDLKLYPVVGKLSVGDVPVPSGSIQLRADTSQGNKSMEVPVGLIQPDGRLELTTGERKGAPLGWWKLLVVADNFQVFEPPPSPDWPLFPEGWEPPKSLVHARYLGAGTTDISIQVVAIPKADAYVIKLNP